MSSTIHMETDRVRDVARQFSLTGEQIQQDTTRLLREVMAIDWQAPSREIFVLDLKQLIQKLETFAENGIQLAGKVQHEVDEWQEVDSSGGTSLASIAVAPAMSASKFLGNTWSNIKGLFDPANFNEGVDYILSTEAGKQLIEEAKKNGIGFKLPDGRIIGDENGKIIPVRFGDSGEGARGVYKLNPDGDLKTQDQEIVISDDWLVRRTELNGRDGLGNTLAHEMQHALDDQKGLMEFKPFHGSLNDETAVERYLQGDVEKYVATEVRAWERGNAVEIDRAYVDDGVISGREAQKILDRGYEATYEKAINESDFGKKYTADVYVDDAGKVRVDLQPKPELAPVFISS